MNYCVLESFDPKQLEKPTFAGYNQKVNLTVFGRTVFGSVSMSTFQGSVFPERLLNTYTMIMKNLDAEVTRVVKLASKRLSESGYNISESTIKSSIDYIGIRMTDDAIKGKPDSIWFEITMSFKGNEHLFSLECIDGQYDNDVSMNG